ncbi:MAG: hypothetical protein DRP65_06405 [Planctomycetota bacterium]|nr:MAG: hypothetical protein DRP65_06405 [Planctomycetota bacterium]
MSVGFWVDTVITRIIKYIFILVLLMLVTAGYLAVSVTGLRYFIVLFPVTLAAAMLLAFLVIFRIIKGLLWLLTVRRKRKTPAKTSKLSTTLSSIVIGIVSFTILMSLVVTVFQDPQKRRSSGGASSIKALKSLPYVGWTPAKEDISKRGVTKYDASKAFDGINLFMSAGGLEVHLIDMKGKRLHTWSARRSGHRFHEMAKLLPNGDLLAIVYSRNLVRMDWDSNVKWVNDKRYNHEITDAPGPDFYVLGREDTMDVLFGLPVPFITDYIAVISPDGQTKRKIPLLKAARRHIPFGRVVKIYRWMLKRDNRKSLLERYKEKKHYLGQSTIFDIFHSNTITVIDKDIEGICKKGDLLICIRELDLVGILDLQTEEFVWTWGQGELSRPHHPTFLENGNIQIFDNGRIRGYSRIIELDPVSRKIVWQYKASPPKSFYTAIRGSAQRLPNGNVLITESDRGRVFEITRGGQIVWEFYNPYVDVRQKKRGVIYRMPRITEPQKYPCLDMLR